MLRWIISPIVLADPQASDFTLRSNHVKLQELTGVNSAAIIPTDAGGQPKYRFALCLAATPSVALIAAVSNAFVFPDYHLDGRMDGMQPDVRTGLVQSVQAYDLDGQGLHLDTSHSDGDSYRDLLTNIGRQFDLAFNPDVLTVPEVAG